ncbi:VOC family protein [Halocatena marina]|uniref:VOC family protein n=1 Tax=Halocatena marina TaxID=2934937 RepID=UPI0020108081|nr:VOC family protein [Halocatena marina]
MDLPVNGVSELVLEVEEMDRAVEFWSETLGFPILEQWNDPEADVTDEGTVWATWLYVGGNTRLGLWLPRDFTTSDLKQKEQPVSSWPATALYDEGGEHVHFALDVDDADFETAREQIEQSGLSTTVREREHIPSRSLYFKDTEDNIIELYTRSIKDTYQIDTTG